MKRWQNKVALVTGATAGIGRAVVEKLGREGMKVAFCGRRKDRLVDVTAELEKLGVEAYPMVCDLRDPEAILALFEGVRKRWGGVDVLVNNAGMGRSEPLMSGDHETWRAMLEVNVLALAICTREAVQDMESTGAGHIIHISSMSAHRVPDGSGMYSASKFAVRSLTEGLRKELREAGSAIRVTSISPGFVETEFAALYHGDEDRARQTYGRYPVMQTDDVADAVAFVLGAPDHVEYHDLLVRPTQQVS